MSDVSNDIAEIATIAAVPVTNTSVSDNENAPNPINKYCTCSESTCKCCRENGLPIVPVRGSGGLGQNTMGMGQGIGMQQQQVPIHQQILAMTTTPYDDNPIFKDLKPISGLSEDALALRPTNPAAQKAILESSSSNQFKVTPNVGNGLKLKPIQSSLSKKSLFGGLEEFDSSVEEKNETVAAGDDDNDILEEDTVDEMSDVSNDIAEIATIAAVPVTNTSVSDNENAPNPINKYCTCSESTCKCCRENVLPIVPVRGSGCTTLQYLEDNKDNIEILLSHRECNFRIKQDNVKLKS
ncbi:Nuclear pore complex protein Nup98-Nup96 [Pseudolycoriella hygida]|uniref:Nuclear pore complex protein Nup98-Nup96 n=1 Tax=Pseudolycoriella hygida TaxID=35572 RepID=A0A9Q0RZP5_9DIPT|nr:Nuclear pore complex protein Nup98-Nup96 [Pseudolycoriella hygida]